MKSIEEAAREYAEQTIDTATDASVSELREYAITDFKAGAEFVQRWIPIEEELPKEGDEVLTKTSDNWHRILTFGSYGKGGFPSQVTHWRPIEFKI